MNASKNMKFRLTKSEKGPVNWKARTSIVQLITIRGLKERSTFKIEELKEYSNRRTAKPKRLRILQSSRMQLSLKQIRGFSTIR